MNAPAQSLSVASYVRRLIKQVESGNGFDIDLNGHAFDVMEEAAQALRARVGGGDLEDDIRRRVEQFAQKSASTNLCCRLVVTDEMPDLPEYDPSSVIVYDGVQDAGSDFSQVIQRATIYGTLMTSVNITDLRTYFESGRKRRLLLFLGTDREADMKALDKMLGALPGILAAAGMDAGAIKEIIAAIKAGTLPAAAMKAIMNIVTIAQLKSMPMTPKIEAAIAGLQKQMPALLARLQSTPGFPSTLMKTFAALIAISVAPVSVTRMSASLRADNDNHRGKDVLRRLIESIRPLARDKALPAQTRRELALILRELRADDRGISDVPRMPAAIARLGTTLAPLALAAAPAASVLRAIPVIAWAALPVMTGQAVTRSVAALRAAPQIADLPPRTQSWIARVAEAPNPPALVRLVTRAPEMVTVLPVVATAHILAAIKPADIMIPGIALQPANPAPVSLEKAPVEKIVIAEKNQVEKAPPEKAVPAEKTIPVDKPVNEKAVSEKLEPAGKETTGPQYNLDGSLKDCCREFSKVNKPEGVTTQGDVVAIFGHDRAASITVAEARDYLQNVKDATRALEQSNLKARDTGDAALQSDTARLIAKLEGNSMSKKDDGHIHTAFCRHGSNLQKKYEESRVKAAEQKIEPLSLRKDQPQKTARKRAFEP